MARAAAKFLLSLFAVACAGWALAQDASQKPQAATAIFAGGCFWCMEEAFEKVPGVSSVVSGYTGGTVPDPTYEQVSGLKNTGHFESIEVHYDPAKVSYQSLVDWYWHNIDPVDAKGQFCDKGTPYRSAIFYQGEEQKKVAEASKQALQASGRFKEPIATQILPAGPFYDAEDYHQDYYKYACGRAARLEQIWGKPTPPPTQ